MNVMHPAPPLVSLVEELCLLAIEEWLENQGIKRDWIGS